MMLKDRRQPWQKKATAYKWARCGTMTTDTANSWSAADRRLPTLNQMRDALGGRNLFQTHPMVAEYIETAKLPAYHKLNADQLFDILYCLAWCRAWGKGVRDYLAGSAEEYQPPLIAA